jgi:hypothetical protein
MRSNFSYLVSFLNCCGFVSWECKCVIDFLISVGSVFHSLSFN